MDLWQREIKIKLSGSLLHRWHLVRNDWSYEISNFAGFSQLFFCNECYVKQYIYIYIFPLLFIFWYVSLHFEMTILDMSWKTEKHGFHYDRGFPKCKGFYSLIFGLMFLLNLEFPHFSYRICATQHLVF